MTTENAAPAPAPAILTAPGMTAAELAALDYDDTLSEEPNAILDINDPAAAQPAGDAAVPVPAADANADPAPAADPAVDPAAPAPAAPAEPAPAAAPAPVPASVIEPVVIQSTPLLVIEAPTDAKERLEQIYKDKEALAEQFDSGDITGSQFQKGLDALNKSERDIETAVNNAELAAKMEKQRQQSVWNGECDAFFKTHAEYADAALFEHFNDTVKAIALMPRNLKLSGSELLVKAHAMVSAELGRPVAAAPAAKPAPKEPAPRAPLPPTLQNLPVADPTAAGTGKYDALDRLASTDPLAYEKKLASMSAVERDAYERA